MTIPLVVGEPEFELGAGQAMDFEGATVSIGHSELEGGVCQINGNGCSMHARFLSFDKELIPTPMKTRAAMRRKYMGESIPSFNTDAKERPVAAQQWRSIAGKLRR